MTKRKIMLITVCFAIFAISLLLSRQFFKSAGKRNMDVPAAGSEQIEDSKDTEEMTELEETERTAASEGAAEPEKVENVTIGSEKYRGFILDCVLHSEQEGDIHYNVYIPDSYDGTKEYALYVTLPGYQGLYFQGVGENIRTEDFGFEAQKYNSEIIIVAPQLNDWGETSADQAGETLALILGKKPELFTAALMCSSKWDGVYEPVTEAKTPVYFVIGESDEYYGSEPFKEAYQILYELYAEQGLAKSEIDNLLVLDIKEKNYFAGTKVTYQHGGGYLFCRDEKIMGWLFGH